MGSEKRRKIKAERKRPMAEAQGREGPQHGASVYLLPATRSIGLEGRQITHIF